MVLILRNKVADERSVPISAFRKSPDVLDEYPHKYVVVTHTSRRWNHDIPWMFCTLVERLEAQGWEAVAWNLGGRESNVVLRRDATSPAPDIPDAGE